MLGRMRSQHEDMALIPLVDLRAQYRSIKAEIDRAISGVLESGQFVLGEEVAAFEAEFAAYCGAAHAVAVSSGTSALHLALLAAGIGPGDEVITVSFTFMATVAAILYTGARPVLVDVDPATCTLNVEQLEAARTPRTKAVLPVHLYGQTADMDPILAFARQHGLIVIEDAAQAHGAEYRGRRAGGMGDLGCFSFYPGKNLGAYGQGGAVVADNPDYARRIRLLRDWGQEQKHYPLLRGYNARLDTLQAAILRVKLRHLEGWTAARQAHAARYDAALGAVEGLVLPASRPNCRHAYHLYVVRLPARDTARRQLREAGIATGLHYPRPVHLLKPYADPGYPPGSLPVSERLAGEVLSLPMYAELPAGTVERVADILSQLQAGRG